MADKDNFGDRMKAYEMEEAGRKLMPHLPVIARLDGKGFSKFTKDLVRPYDERLSRLMVDTVKYLVEETNALCGYTQSDEITLGWYTPPRIENLVFFEGRIQKMVSVLAGECSWIFNRLLPAYIPEKANQKAIFDCRVWAVPTLDEAANAFLWRELDATKNSISMAASAYYKHKELMNKNGAEKQDMLHAKGINWNNYPTFFKRGVYVQRKIVKRRFSVDEIANLPAKHAARTDPNLIVERNEIKALDLPPLQKITNRVQVLFFGEEPALISEDKRN
jgi:tRNA(His) 5'-end guanylyltransferase